MKVGTLSIITVVLFEMLAVIQARMSSARLPGKVLMDLCGRVVLGRLVDRLSAAKTITHIVVATSNEHSDQAIADFCMKEGIKCHRGSLGNVTQRFCQVATVEKVDAFVRISGDSPLIDPAIVDRAVLYYQQEECDLVTNVLVRSFPKGQSVEVIRFESLEAIHRYGQSVDSQEHVTTAFYQDPERYRIVGFTSGIDAGKVNLSIDTPDDLIRLEKIVKACGDVWRGWRDLLGIYNDLQK